MTRIEAVRGDITEQQVDAVVNAANSSLLGAVPAISTGTFGRPRKTSQNSTTQTAQNGNLYKLLR